MMCQKEFLEKIKSRLSLKSSIIQEIADALDIGYDASYRRVSCKSKFSLQESVVLANKFAISLDELQSVSSTNNIITQKTNAIYNEKDLVIYFNNSYEQLKNVIHKKNAHIYYSAKDIPIFYYLENNRLSDFKYYAWLKLINPEFRFKSFEEYYPSLDLIQSAKKLSQLYENISVSEIWDITSINSVLKQIYFYFKAGQLKLKMAVDLCELLKNLLDRISDKVLDKEKKFSFYYNELLLMNNNVLITTTQQKLLYVPFSMLTYFFTSDNNTCNEAMMFFDNQILNSKLMNTSGEKEQNTFYFKMIQKIDALINLMKSEQILDFQ